MRIRRKKLWGIFSLAIAIPALLMFFLISLVALFSEKAVIEKLLFLFFFSISSFGLYSTRLPLLKIFSKNPEFELSENELLIFDNPLFSKIPYSDMLACKIFHASKTTLIGITLKETSVIRSNSNSLQRRLLGVPRENKKIVFLGLDFAKVDSGELNKMLSKKIIEHAKNN